MISPDPKHRVLIYGMQSSGASVFTLLVGQMTDAIVVIDLRAPFVAPRLADVECPVVLKAVMVAEFGPTQTILLVRHPADVVASLSRKPYRDLGLSSVCVSDVA